MFFLKRLLATRMLRPAGSSVSVAEATAASVRDCMDGGDFYRAVPERAVSLIVCLVGSPAMRLSDTDAARAYASANPTWRRSHAVKVLYASRELASKRECSLECVQAIVGEMAHRETVLQARTAEIAIPGRALQMCFATVFGHSSRTEVFLLDEPIPFA